ncbi:NlpC/P60 family protein [Palleronia abyssalis]|uniref:NlpC/P60 family protein n=1 Tax=Palleronia abyssalis TaxID=1501240 RepID=UPI000D54E51C|nr:NlpC/P60 family protein [Palleronia abyssalis]
MNDIVDAARRWIGTPYVHRASCRGAGCDCLGLIRGVWQDISGEHLNDMPAYSPDWNEAVGREELLTRVRAYFAEEDRVNVHPGRIILFRMKPGAVAKHLGIATGPDRFVHSYSGRGVCETSLSDPWRRKIVACFEFKRRAV